MRKIENILIAAFVGLLWLGLTFIIWFHPVQKISESERRILAQFPELRPETVLSGKFMKDFEEYSKDQFPNRFGFRSLNAYTRIYLFAQKDTNNIYIEDGFAAKLEYPLNENSVQTANNRFLYLYEKYMKDKEMNIYFSVIPDKGYYLAELNGYPAMDYELMFDLIREGTGFAKHIDITDILSIEDYYRTDVHWKQENLIKIANRFYKEMGLEEYTDMEFGNIKAHFPFYGVYYGQLALLLEPDEINYLTNETINDCTVYNLETDGTTSVYDLDKLNGRDPYDVFLSGAAPLLIVENPNADTNRELIVFRDSFGSSLIPLILEGYSKVTLVDTRYIASDLLGEYIDFNGQDVLFLYSTLILNSAAVFR